MEDSDGSDDDTEGLLPFEKYLLKRRKRQKEYRKSKKQHDSTSEKRYENDEDIPDDLKNDPFFKAELDIRKREMKERAAEERSKQDKAMADEEVARIKREVRMLRKNFLLYIHSIVHIALVL